MSPKYLDVRAEFDSEREKSNCSRRTVAATIYRDHTFISRGHNRLPNGDCRAGDCPRGRASFEDIPSLSSYAGNCEAIHAEDMAIQNAKALGETDFSDCTIYVSYDPCPQCATLIESAGIGRTVVMNY